MRPSQHSSHPRARHTKKKKPQGKGRRPSRPKNKRPSPRLQGLEHYLAKYQRLMEAHLEARAKYYRLFHRSSPRQLAKLEAHFSSTMAQVRHFEEGIPPQHREAFRRRIEGPREDTTYSQNRGLSPGPHLPPADAPAEDPPPQGLPAEPLLRRGSRRECWDHGRLQKIQGHGVVMGPRYDFASLENKWQAYWEKHKSFRCRHDSSRPKYYILDMFPYPSGAGLHVGHCLGYTATDIVARYKRMRGFHVLHPMGWDSFGLPAENYAIKTGTHPAQTTAENIQAFRAQLKALGFSYDWDREVATSDPSYYRWTQWLFIRLYNKGLVYETEANVNWCEALGCVLANEEVVDGLSEVGGHPVVKRPMVQWALKITDYADRLLEDLEDLDWPENIKELQRNWIGRSLGASITFSLQGHGASLTVFTTRADTLFGATYMVLAPEHPLTDTLTTEEHRQAVAQYRDRAQRKSDLERTDLNREKTGVFTGAMALNPATGQPIPLWVADYVLASYGTGAVMGVPAHDQRDWEFAKKFHLPILPVVEGGNLEREAYLGDGPHINSPPVNGLDNRRAQEAMISWLEENNLGGPRVNYKLRDWIFSRQRYWGEPFPILKDADTGEVVRLLNLEELPLELPPLEDFTPQGRGESPLAKTRQVAHLR